MMKAKSKVSKSARCGLTFPVGRIHKYLKDGNFAPRVSSSAAIYLTACVEYLTAELLELSAEMASNLKKQRITPRHIMLAIKHDEELNKMLSGVTIVNGGVVPGIHASLLPAKTAKSKKEEA